MGGQEEQEEDELEEGRQWGAEEALSEYDGCDGNMMGVWCICDGCVMGV